MRGRGVDFKHRLTTSRWAEDLLIRSLDGKQGLKAVRYGISTYAPQGNELVYGTSEYKEPDLLLFQWGNLSKAEKAALADGTIDWTDRSNLGESGLADLLRKAYAAVEIEFSPYKASEMKDRDWKPRTQAEWARRPLKHANPPSAPNIWVKEEDIEKLALWEDHHKIPMVVAHFFDQEAFAVALGRVRAFRSDYRANEADQKRLQMTTGIFAKLQSYDRIDAQGASEKKPVYVISPAAAIKLGDITGVKVECQLDVSSSKKYVSQVVFSGGKLQVSDEFMHLLDGLPRKRS